MPFHHCCGIRQQIEKRGRMHPAQCPRRRGRCRQANAPDCRPRRGEAGPGDRIVPADGSRSRRIALESRPRERQFYSRRNIFFPAGSWRVKTEPKSPKNSMKAKDNIIQHDQNHDGLDRRGFLQCMAWAGTGMLWTVSGGLLGSTELPLRAARAELSKASFSFVQISDSHIGFSKEGINTDVTATLKQAIARINAL